MLYICIIMPNKEGKWFKRPSPPVFLSWPCHDFDGLSHDVPNEKSPLDVPNSSPSNCWFKVETYKIPSKSQISA